MKHSKGKIMTDISDFFGEIDPNEGGSSGNEGIVKAGRYDLKFIGTVGDGTPIAGQNGWLGLQLMFSIEGGLGFASHTITLKHDDPKKVQWGKQDIIKMSKAMGIEGSWKNTDEIKGKVASCMVIVDGDRNKVDSKFGTHWQPAKGKTEIKPAPKVENKPADNDSSDEIPF